MQISKQLTVRLFFNLSTRTFYVQLGEQMYFVIPDKTATAIQSKEQIEIIHANDLKDMQQKSNEG